MASAIDQAQAQEQTASLTAQQLRAAMLATGAALRTHSMQSTADPRLTAHLPYRQEFRALCEGLMAAIDRLDGSGNLRG